MAYAKSTSAHARECPNHRDNHLCSPALRAGEYEKLSETDIPSCQVSVGWRFPLWARGLNMNLIHRIDHTLFLRRRIMKRTLYPTPGDFLQDNRLFLEEHEALCQLNLRNAQANREDPCSPSLLFGRYEANGEPVLLFGSALPWNLCLNAPSGTASLSAQAAAELAAWLRAENIPIAGVTAREELCQAFMGAYGGEFTQRSAMDIMVLTELIEPPAVSGTVRPAQGEDLDTICQWAHAFYREALHEEGDPETIRQHNQERIQKGEIRVLELPGGELASMAHTSRETERGIAISGVYTPPEHRGKGYCQATVGALCRELLARGKDYCTLFVNRENPISNRVYRKTGFQVLEDCWEYRLEEPSSSR